MIRYFLVYFLIIPFLSYAQEDTVRFKRPATELTYYTLQTPDKYRQIDTTISGTHEYEPIRKFSFPYNNLGNTGSAHFPLLFRYEKPLGAHLGFSQYDLYFSSPSELKFYNPPFPFTYLDYVQGMDGEQIFGVAHSQNIRGQLNLGVNYKLMAAKGIYANERTNVDDLNIYARYRSDDRRYNMITGFIVNDADNFQNGGLDIPDPQVAFTIRYKETLPVDLRTASSDLNRKYVFIQHSYDIGSTYTVQVDAPPPAEDTMTINPEVLSDTSVVIDTAAIEDTSPVRIFYPKLRLMHYGEVFREKYEYSDTDPNTEYYPDIFISEDSTFDHTHNTTITNRIGIKYLGISKQNTDTTIFTNFSFEAFARHEWVHLDQQSRRYDIQNIFLEGRIGSNELKDPRFLYGIAAGMGVAGRNIGDHKILAEIGYQGEGFKNINASLTKHLTSPALIENTFFSNHYYWDQELNKEDILQLSAAYKIPFIDLGVRFNHFLINRYIYWNASARPVQADDVLILNQLELHHEMNFGKFYFLNYIGAQLWNRQEILHLPEIVTRHRVYYQGRVFAGNLLIQTGLDVKYNTGYLPDAFSPVTGQFYIQNSYENNPYPVIDIFINAQVGAARAFFIVQHANQGLLFPAGYYNLPGYPHTDRTFKFGVTWMLFN